MDTIFAVSSGRPPAAIAVLRVSGPAASEVAIGLTGDVPKPRKAVVRVVRDTEANILDRALVLWFPGPYSATGEDLLELHLHGGRAVIAAVEAAVRAIGGTRAAAPGEFTRRALLNGRIDLAQASGLADLLAAETEAQRRAAISSAEGMLSEDLHRWLDRVSEARALVEAMIDYDEEGDVAVTMRDIQSTLAALADELDLATIRPSVERLAEGLKIVIAGPPNAGKSSLFNALVERNAAIVTPIAGTTRDRIEARIVRHGAIFTVIDTAGLADDTDDPVEREGIVRSRDALAGADIVLWLGDDPPAHSDHSRSLWVRSRCDEAGREALLPGQIQAVSVNRPETIAPLWELLSRRGDAVIPPTEGYLLHQEQASILRNVAAHCRAALDAVDPVLCAEELRLASAMLGRLLGIDETEAMLDRLFSRFCVGK